MGYNYDESRFTSMSPLQKIVFQVVNKIRNERNFDEAANIIINNNLTIEQIATTTLRLSFMEIAKLADFVINKKH